MKKTRKGFTIVELVIVIAVIAILSAVLIPTFSGIIKKANLSADQQAVRQMNTALQVASIDQDIDEIEDVRQILEEAGFNAKSYNALTNKTRFVWVKNQGMVAHVDETNGDKIIFPEELKDILVESTNCFNLVNYPNEDGVPVALAPYTELTDEFYSQMKSALSVSSNEEVENALASPVQLCKFMPKDTNIEGDTNYLEEREMYGEWYADFYIRANDDFDGSTVGLYGEHFVGMALPLDDLEIKAGDSMMLLEGSGWNLSYEGLLWICEPDSNGERLGFICGAYNKSTENIGKSITVQLRLYEPDENGERTGNYVICNEIVYTFKNK